MLKNVLVFAKSIVVESGFRGNCQLFAADSIRVESDCHFEYPSCLGVLRSANSTAGIQSKISIGEKSDFNGNIFTYEKTASALKMLISIESKVKISGQVYAQGILELKDNTEIDGSTFANRFLYKTTFTRFENYLINITLDARALSPYYLTSDLLPVASKKKRILQWLEAN